MTAKPVITFERVDASLDNPATFALADLLPESDRTHGGRPSHYPRYMVIVYEALISVYGSARQVEAELAHPLVWNHIRKVIRRGSPNHRPRLLPAAPMRRHHYHYARGQCLASEGVLD